MLSNDLPFCLKKQLSVSPYNTGWSYSLVNFTTAYFKASLEKYVIASAHSGEYNLK